MKELNVAEIQAVSGAGIFSDAGTLIGQAIGGIVGHYKGTEEQSSKIGLDLGKTIGGVVDQSISMISSWFKSVKK
ncbi:hypothetical protein L9H26_13670 [Morganella psychrotolerans]|uniref:Uncharacterized protein n=1 Tax=Morganella psychrotolerans TaxID=368603 RepID=A0A5M9R3I7_9GAMM|nr:hypothetical protein [Morganella psychrotolerans]KAA8714837.1 hypothetical protein F4V73_13440 [Morganella psychrotolerans]OBU04567.1 hypothetical protein AYY16_12465 [Morganella psychrotolerans]